jgi:hypothetical protein
MILAEEVGELAAAVRDASGETGDARALAVIRLLVTAGEEAKAWVRDHPWPQRQQRVIDGEGGERPGSGRRDGS